MTLEQGLEMALDVGREALLEDVIGLDPAALDVAHHDAGAIADVAVALEDRDRGVVAPALVDQGRAGRERGGQVEHRWQRLVLRLDRGQGRLRGLEGDRGDRRHRLAHVADHVRGEDRLVLHRGAVADVGRVGRGDDRAHAGDARGARGVEPHQTGVRLRAAEDLAVEHAGQREVRRVDRAARHLARRVDARKRLAGDPGPGAHDATAPPAIRLAAASTASTIFW